MTPAQVLQRLADVRGAIEATTLPANIGTLFDSAVARFAGRTLWVGIEGGASLTYAAFGAEVERCVAALHGCGVRRGTHVGLMLPSVPALAITWMALAKLGAVMVPVNTAYTARELDYVLAEADVSLLVVDAAHVALLDRADGPPPLPRSCMIMHGGSLAGSAGEWRALLDAAAPLRERLAEPELDQLMTIQFTSGSTGPPKGCLLTHRYWVTIGLVRSNQGPPVARMLIDMPFHYMGGQWRFLMALYLGATACVARQQTLAHMLDRLIAAEIEFCSVTPALAKQALHPGRDRLRLRWAGTMAMPRDLHGAVEAQLGGAPVREMYGTTETGATLAMPVAVDWMTGSGACGLPAPFRQLRIVDPQGEDVATGETGELWISGPGVMLGYDKRPEANAAAWHGAWFRTGDLFRCDGDGFLTVLGRIKDVIRRSGENVSAVEVETVLCIMDEIVEAAALPVPDPVRGEEVKVCVVLRPGLSEVEVAPERILAHCRERLARFKLPRYLAYLPMLPKTPSGKIAKQQLRLPDRDPRLGAYDVVDQVWR